MQDKEYATQYYDRFSHVYDLVSSKYYYRHSRQYAIDALELQPNQTILNVPCGTGRNLEYLQDYLQNTGLIIGIDLSTGMLQKAIDSSETNGWDNTKFYNIDVRDINDLWVQKNITLAPTGVDAVLCDLGLSGFPEWQRVIDNLLTTLKRGGKIVILDWYLDKPSLRGEFVKWIGKGEVNRPIWQYLQTKVSNFKLEDKFNRGGVFVASGIRN